MIAAVELTRRFGSHTAVEDVSFEVGRSEIVALLGPNGAGKTTTMRMLAGLIAPTSGRVLIDGIPVTGKSSASLRRRVGFLTEAPGLWERLTVRENLRVYAGLYGVADGDHAIDRALDTLELSARADTRTAELSKGLRQKVAIARALLHNPRVLLLDEPMSGLDPEIRRTVRQLLEERRAAGCAILVSTHDLDETERLADRVAVLQGRLLALDRPEALRQRLGAPRLLLRVVGDAAIYVETAIRVAGPASADGASLVVRVCDLERDTPALVRALTLEGARILEVRPEVPRLEDVYLHLTGGASSDPAGRA